MARRLKNFVDGFFDYTHSLSSPEIFRKWAAISVLGGALERKVWVRTNLGVLFPNMYIFVISPPGVGKSLLTSRVRSMWKELPESHVAAASLTRASIIDDLAAATRNIVRPKEIPSVITYNSLCIAANELGVLVPTYEQEFMAKLTDIYDCGDYSEKRRGSDIHVDLDAVQINLFAAGTPSYLSETLPIGAWDQGFLSRVILVYSGEMERQDLFTDAPEQSQEKKDLENDLEHISKLYGKMSFTKEYQMLFSPWHKSGGKPAPSHPRLQHYNTRRSAHLLKLSMIASVAESDDLVIRKRHYQTAMDWLIEVELHMPDIFKAMAQGGDMQLIKECWHFMFDAWIKENKPLPESLLFTFLAAKTPPHNVVRIVEIMIKAGILREQMVAKLGKCYVPRPPKE